ncbi:YqjF family protein [Flavobacteriaceae bacterium LMO-SS05]
MKAKDILKQTKHRAFNYPNRPWKYYQEWNQVLFFHWQLEPDELRPMLPKGLELDTIHGKTWLSIVAFDMNHVGIRNFPKIPNLSNFHEINIRLYVNCNGKPSVYFLNMEGSKPMSCKVLKAVSKLPYRYSKMRRTASIYESKNKATNDFFYTEYAVEQDPISKDETDLWLTERYTLLQDFKNKIITYDVHHIEWPMQKINIHKLELDYPKFNSLLQNKPDRIQYSKGVQVLTWDKKDYKHE